MTIGEHRAKRELADRAKAEGVAVTISTYSGNDFRAMVHDAGSNACWFIVPGGPGREARDEIVKWQDIETILAPIS